MRAAFALPTDLFLQRHFPVPQARALRMVRVLQAKGAEVRLVEWLRWPAALPEREERDGLRFVRLRWPVPAGGLVTRVRFLRKLSARVEAELAAAQPEGIVVQDGELLAAALAASRKLGVPLFYDSQEHWVGMVGGERPLEARLYDLLERRAARHLAHVYTVSEPIAERFRGLGCKVALIYNSRDDAEVQPLRVPKEEARRRLGLPADAFVLGFTGSLSPESGLGPCIEALRGLPADVRMAVVGGPAEELKRLEGLAREAGVGDRLALHPPVPQAEATALACAFDVGLLALTGEGPNYDYRAPYKLFDYMALGLPTILSDYPEMARIAVKEAGFALPVRPGDAAGIRAAALRLRDQPGLREALAGKARAAFEGTFSGERQKDRLRASHGFWR